jgi:hypothetical protein
MSYVPPRYVNDGEYVWIAWPTKDKPRQGARVRVACAAGTSARVVSEFLGVVRWFKVEHLLVPPDDPRA